MNLFMNQWTFVWKKIPNGKDFPRIETSFALIFSSAQQLTIDLLETLTKSAVITYDQLKTGMLRLFDDIEDIHLDVPNVYEQLQVLLKQLSEKKVLNQDITSNAPQKGRKRVTSEGENNKQDKA